jgi:hypothetical protein
MHTNPPADWTLLATFRKVKVSYYPDDGISGLRIDTVGLISLWIRFRFRLDFLLSTLMTS